MMLPRLSLQRRPPAERLNVGTDERVEPFVELPPAATLGEVRIPYAPWIAAGLCLTTFVWLLTLVRRLDFFGDEWFFLDTIGNWSLADYLRPHNEHWATIPKVTYRVLLDIFGATSYLPFNAVLLVLHVCAAFLMFLIVRRRCGDLLGLAAAALLLVMGHGSENIFWAFQIAFVGSVAFGLLAIYLLMDESTSRRRAAIASASMVVALAFSGIGLFMVAAVGVDLLVDRRRRRLLWTLAAPVIIYGIWYLVVGRAYASVHRSPLSLAGLYELVGYVPSGIGPGLAGMVSLEFHYGQLALALGAAVFAVLIYRSRSRASLAIGAGVALVLQFAATGLVRAQFGDAQASSSRYVYVVAVLGLLIFSLAARDIPWRGAWRPTVVIVLAAITIHNVYLMDESARNRTADLQVQRTELETTWLLRDAPGFASDSVVDTFRAPTLAAGAYVRAREHLGSAYADITVAELEHRNPVAVNHAVRVLLPLRAATVPTSADPPTGDCRTIGGLTPAFEFTAGDGDPITITATGAVMDHLDAGQWYVGATLDAPLDHVAIGPGQTLEVTVADSGLGLVRHVVLVAPPGAEARICR